MTNARVTHELTRSPGSIDMVRVIRRSMRCFVFGVIGLVPLFGAGFACQALRLRHRVSADVQDGWTPPPLYCYWLLGGLAMMAGNSLWSVPGDVTVCVALLSVQSWHCWRSFQRRSETIWNPADHELFWGALFAYAGLGLTLWTVVVLVLQVIKMVGL
jgi:hypothetical protein